MRFIKGILTGLLIGSAIGAWVGFNLGRDAPLESNPFTEWTLSDRVKDSAGDAYDKTRDALQKSIE